MCEFCTDDKEYVKRGFEIRAEQLERLAGKMRSLGSGIIKPHSPDAQNLATMARAVLKFLAEDWL